MIRRDIVVMGASAGGVQALVPLLKRIPRRLPAAFFVVVHHSMHHALAEILGYWSRMPVRVAADFAPFLAGNVYVAPGDYYLKLEKGLMRVEHSPKEGLHRPGVDALFRSAALAYGRRVVGVVLSGMMDDGTEGLLEIKKRGGVAIIQDLCEAEYPGMPRSALDTVPVDFVLPVLGIAEKLIELAGGCGEGRLARVLIVKSAPGTGARLKEQLEDTGYRAGTCGSGERALELGAGTRPDVVLMDMHAGRGTGSIEAAQWICDRYRVPLVLIECASGGAREQVRAVGAAIERALVGRG